MSCAQLDCTFDASGSSDTDGTVTTYDWDFGDGATGSGQAVAHSFPAAGTFPVTLTVTDDDGAPGATTTQVSVSDSPPPALTFNGVRHVRRQRAASEPAGSGPGRGRRPALLFVTTNRAATATTPAGWTLRSTVSDGTDVRSWVYTTTAAAGSAGSSVSVALDALSKTDVTLLAYSGPVRRPPYGESPKPGAPHSTRHPRRTWPRPARPWSATGPTRSRRPTAGPFRPA